LFIVWGGLRGAVPILLAAFAVLAQVDGAQRIYGIVFVVVAFSVAVQGTSIPLAARLLGVRMRPVEPPSMRRFVVAADSRASGETVRDLHMGERSWIARIARSGRDIDVHGSTVFDPGDEVFVITDVDDAPGLGRLFEARWRAVG
jgi:cell volume regulation protein A